ncbi:hypothetical protein [Rhizobium sp. BR 315]|uniref:hypothetical protein n=1 Tax=Rhizobium sp. BR 315 TaxID=3040014 RepID=UPI003D331787
MARSDRPQTGAETREYASPACVLHEVDPTCTGISSKAGRKLRDRDKNDCASETIEREGRSIID